MRTCRFENFFNKIDVTVCIQVSVDVRVSSAKIQNNYLKSKSGNYNTKFMKKVKQRLKIKTILRYKLETFLSHCSKVKTLINTTFYLEIILKSQLRPFEFRLLNWGFNT